METLTPPKNATELKSFYTWMGEDGICRTVTKAMAEIDLEAAVENSATVNGFYTTKKFPLLIDSRNIKSITREAREQFSTNNRETNVTCFAIMVKSPLSRVIGNFFMGLNKPKVPARLFDNETNAVEWLKKHL